MEKDIIKVTESYDEISLEELEEKIEMDCNVYSPTYTACCW